MGTAEIKLEIHQVLDNVPEESLQSILDYIKQFQGQQVAEARLVNNLNKILSEDNGLLKRLAQ
jgi:hypothetical protein